MNKLDRVYKIYCRMWDEDSKKYPGFKNIFPKYTKSEYSKNIKKYQKDQEIKDFLIIFKES